MGAFWRVVLGRDNGKPVVDIDSDGSRGGGYGKFGKELMRRGRTKSSGYTAGRRLTNHQKKSMGNMLLEVPASGGHKKHTRRRKKPPQSSSHSSSGRKWVPKESLGMCDTAAPAHVSPSER